MTAPVPVSLEAPIYGGKSVYTPDTEKYEKIWVPKIKAYRQKLADATPKEYLAPAELLPETDLDTTPFNATEVPAKVLDAESLEITESTAVTIAKKIAAKEWTATQVFTAFAKRATLAHQLTNCAMEILFDIGFKRAKELDEYQEKTGKTIGPFHGVPISVKENGGFEGRVTTAGYVGCLDDVTEKFSLSYQIVYDLGAVFYIRTTEPQTLMHLDSINNITGRGRNCYKTSMSPGGSSSGEGSIVGMKGSAIGIGSDIGGSVRGPAAFNGVYGLKPSSRRISPRGGFRTAEFTTSEMIVATLGPLSNSVEDLEFFMKNYVEQKPWLQDPNTMPIPWTAAPVPKPSELTIGICYDDGVVKPHPPVIRALKHVEAKLRAAGVNVVTWEPHRVYDAVSIGNYGFTADGNYGSKLRLEKSGEPLAPLTAHYMTFGRGDAGVSVVEFETLTTERDTLRTEYHDLFTSRGVDFVIAPTYVGTAPKPSTVKYWGYTLLWNLLDSTCVTFPSGVFASKDLDPKDDSYKPRNKFEEYEYGLYDPEASDGLPVGLTLVGKRYTEEAALKASQVVDDILKA